MACNDIPRLLVERDAASPAEPRYGLFAAAVVVEDMDPRAGNGVTYATTCTPGVYPYPVGDCDEERQVKHPERSIAITTADPFAVYAAESCPPVGRGNTNQQVAALRRRLLMGERHVVEDAVYNGHSGASPYLRHEDTAQIDAGGDGLALAQAVGVLEQWLSARGRTGIIHAPRWLAPVMDELGIVHRDGPRMRTLLGNAVAFGSGYSGQGPEGTDDTSVWLYATPQVTIRRSTIMEQRSFDPRINQPFDLAERLYVADWPCEAVAVRTTLTRIDGVVPDPDPPQVPTLTITPSSGVAPLSVVMTPTWFGGAQVDMAWVEHAPVRAITDDGVGYPITFTTPGTYTVYAVSMEDPSITATATVTVTGPIEGSDEAATGPEI